jgi:hypothetical protein
MAEDRSERSARHPLEIGDAPITWRWWIVECGAIVALCFAIAGWMAPGVNEAHYWGKAKHAWDPTWCSRDLFLSSAEAHWFYEVTWGSLTRLVSLPAAAWIGRFLGWTAIAIGWTYLIFGLAPRRGAALFSAAIWFAAVQYGHLGGEWVIGGTEAKVPAYSCVLLGLGAAVRGQRAWVWPWLGLASAFHVLVGGWTTLILGLSGQWWTAFRVQPLRLVAGLICGLAFASFGLLPAILLTFGAPRELVQRAAEIYTYERLPHHLWARTFSGERFASFACMIVVTYGIGYLSGSREHLRILRALAAGSLILAGLGMLISVMAPAAPGLSAQLLRLYLFRMADISVPMLCAASFACWFADGRLTPVRSLCLSLALIASSIGLGLVSWDAIRWNVPPACRQSLLALTPGISREQGEIVWQDWVNVCRWIEQHTDPDELLLTPRHQQTFKWYSNRGEVVNWKDMPQDAESLVAWQERLEDIYPARIGGTRVSIRFEELRRLARRYGVRLLVADRRLVPEYPLVRVYPTGTEQNTHFAVYRLPRLEDEPAPPDSP